MFANYKYSLSSKQQQQIQLFLRMIPEQVIRSIEDVSIVGEGAFQLLHQLTYAQSWTETPQSKLPEVGVSVPQLNAQDL